MVSICEMLTFELKIISLIFKRKGNKLTAEWEGELVKAAIPGNKRGQATAGVSASTPATSTRRLECVKRAVFTG